MAAPRSIAMQRPAARLWGQTIQAEDAERSQWPTVKLDTQRYLFLDPTREIIPLHQRGPPGINNRDALRVVEGFDGGPN